MVGPNRFYCLIFRGSHLKSSISGPTRLYSEFPQKIYSQYQRSIYISTHYELMEVTTFSYSHLHCTTPITCIGDPVAEVTLTSPKFFVSGNFNVL